MVFPEGCAKGCEHACAPKPQRYCWALPILTFSALKNDYWFHCVPNHGIMRRQQCRTVPNRWTWPWVWVLFGCTGNWAASRWTHARSCGTRRSCSFRLLLRKVQRGAGPSRRSCSTASCRRKLWGLSLWSWAPGRKAAWGDAEWPKKASFWAGGSAGRPKDRSPLFPAISIGKVERCSSPTCSATTPGRPPRRSPREEESRVVLRQRISRSVFGTWLFSCLWWGAATCYLLISRKIIPFFC